MCIKTVRVPDFKSRKKDMKIAFARYMSLTYSFRYCKNKTVLELFLFEFNILNFLNHISSRAVDKR